MLHSFTLKVVLQISMNARWMIRVGVHKHVITVSDHTSVSAGMVMNWLMIIVPVMVSLRCYAINMPGGFVIEKLHVTSSSFDRCTSG